MTSDVRGRELRAAFNPGESPGKICVLLRKYLEFYVNRIRLLSVGTCSRAAR